jgi:Bacterial mobilisation protein (MobC).
VSAEYARRSIKVSVRFNEAEHELLKKRMTVTGTGNQEAFIRKLALDGLVVKLDVPELKEMISLLRYSGNNINQIAKRLHETGRTYEADIADIKANQERLIELSNTIISKLAAIK